MATKIITINEKKLEVDVDDDMPMLWVLRDFLNMKGTKYGCGMGLCGACTIHINGKPVRSCQIKVSDIKSADAITTIEGVDGVVAKNVQQAWIEEQVPQCGYCQSGQIMSAVALLQANNKPDRNDINNAMSGNLCRCGTYDRIVKAIHKAAQLNTNLS